MSAALAWEAEPLLDGGSPGTDDDDRVGGRPRLRLVPNATDRDCVAGQRGVAAARMTRRGRLLRLVGLMAVAGSLAWSLLGALSAGATPQRDVTVQSGQTLSEVAARELPRLPVREGVAQIQLANRLSSSEIHAGQVLQIPAVG